MTVDSNATVTKSTVASDPYAYIEAICVVVSVGCIMGILMLIFVICFGEKSAKKADISSYHSYSRDTEILRDSSIVVLNSTELYADQVLRGSQHPQPSHSIFREGELLTEVMEEVHEDSTNTENKEEGNMSLAIASVYEQSTESASIDAGWFISTIAAGQRVDGKRENRRTENEICALEEYSNGDAMEKLDEKVEVNDYVELSEGSFDTHTKNDENSLCYGNSDNVSIETANISNDAVDESGRCSVLAAAPEMKVHTNFKDKHKCEHLLNCTGTPNTSPMSIKSPSNLMVSILGAQLSTGQSTSSCATPLPPTSS